jgi:molybdenum cofactor cytidylyltransferase
MISCILLCAGLSERFPSIKALAPIATKPVIEHLQNTLLATNVDEIIIVLGAHRLKIEPHITNHPKIKTVYNENFILGQTTSFQKGLTAISKQSQAAMLLPIDSAFVKKETLNTLMDTFEKELPTILIPTSDGKKGHPPIFNKKLFQEIESLTSDKGINTIIRKYNNDEKTLEIKDPGIVDSFNTPQEFQNLLKKYNLI